jgi:hypothetical protein
MYIQICCTISSLTLTNALSRLTIILFNAWSISDCTFRSDMNNNCCKNNVVCSADFFITATHLALMWVGSVIHWKSRDCGHCNSRKLCVPKDQLWFQPKIESCNSSSSLCWLYTANWTFCVFFGEWQQIPSKETYFAFQNCIKDFDICWTSCACNWKFLTVIRPKVHDLSNLNGKETMLYFSLMVKNWLLHNAALFAIKYLFSRINELNNVQWFVELVA